jgi:hypothetical protein
VRDKLNPKREAMMLALVVAVAVTSSWLFDQPPLNWINAVFVSCYLAHRAVLATRRRRAATGH